MHTNPFELDALTPTEPLSDEERAANNDELVRLVTEDPKTRVLIAGLEAGWQLYYLARQLLSAHLDNQVMLRMILEHAAAKAMTPFDTAELAEKLRKTFLPMMDGLSTFKPVLPEVLVDAGFPYIDKNEFKLPRDSVAALFCPNESALAATMQLTARAAAERGSSVLFFSAKHPMTHPNVVCTDYKNFMRQAKNISGMKRALDELLQRIGKIDMVVIADDYETTFGDKGLQRLEKLLHTLKTLQHAHKFAAVVGVRRAYSLLEDVSRSYIDKLQQHYMVRHLAVGDDAEDGTLLRVVFHTGWMEYKLPKVMTVESADNG